ncbi:cytochrome P450 [Epithele typhae]|uniref:cytochrome P450 n=1 Tax=Epithele typhae TaxID=378194 RepID=UPI002007CA52|nr:cytochrome P450 [Epithele typhae]KAH9912197.1 cytochrome P450 [Epithele typhae]
MERSSPALLTVGVAALATFVALRFLRSRSPLSNIDGPPSTSWVLGSLGSFFSLDNLDFVRHVQERYGPVALFNSPLLGKVIFTRDLKALHSVYIKDAEVWSRGKLNNVAGQAIMGPGLLTTHGDMHRRQRKMLTPVFSAAYMRSVTPLFYDIIGKLEDAIGTRLRAQGGSGEVDMVAWMGRAALELVGQGILGHSFDPLVADTKDEFTEAVKSFSPTLAHITYALAILSLVRHVMPARLGSAFARLWPDPHTRRMKWLSDFLYGRSRALFEEKRARLVKGEDAELAHQVGEGQDVMSILLRENMLAKEEDRLPDDQIVAQVITFIIAGVDTTSNSLARVLDVLSKHPDAQKRLREEVLEAREAYGKEIPYDDLSALPYLDAVCRETLRLLSPVGSSMRECVTQAEQDTTLPLQRPITGKDGAQISEIIVPKGTFFIADISGVNTSKELWGADAHQWKPERWLGPLPAAVEEAHIPGIYAHQMTFIGGGMSCIGFKFSQLEMKMVLATLVAAFEFKPSKKSFVWNSAGVSYPSAKMGDKDPQMILEVSLAKSSWLGDSVRCNCE